MTDNINKHFHIQNKKYNSIKHKKYFKPCTYIAPFILCLTLSGCNNISHYNINNVLSQANIVSKDSSEKQYISSKDELIEKIIDTMEHNLTSCTLYTTDSSIFDADELIHTIAGLTQIQCTLKQSGSTNILEIFLDYWDNYPISYAFKHNDTSLLDDKQLELYNSYINILSQVTSSSNSDWENELAIHDYLVSHITYTDGIAGNKYAYNAIINGTAVCSGYTEAFKTFMDFLGIENTTVSGTAKGEKHIWNMVCLDGEWYHTDVTWDDPVNGNDIYIEHGYFNITDNDIGIDHSWNYKTAEANGTKYSYINIANIPNITSDNELSKLVTSAVNENSEYIEFTSRIPLDITSAFDNVNKSLSYYYKNTSRHDYTLYTIIFSY